jgi:hypothetical protein
MRDHKADIEREAKLEIRLDCVRDATIAYRIGMEDMLERISYLASALEDAYNVADEIRASLLV